MWVKTIFDCNRYCHILYELISVLNCLCLSKFNSRYTLKKVVYSIKQQLMNSRNKNLVLVNSRLLM